MSKIIYLPPTYLEDVFMVLQQYLNGESNIKISDILNDRISNNKLSVNKLAKYLGIIPKTMYRFLSGEYDISVSDYISIIEYLGIANFPGAKIYKLEKEHDNELQKRWRQASLIGHLHRNFNLPLLKKMGEISSVDNFDSIIDHIQKKFEIDSIFDYSIKDYANIVAFSRAQKKPDIRMAGWFIYNIARNYSSSISKFDFDINGLMDFLPKLRAYTVNEKYGWKFCLEELNKLGITVSLQQMTPGTHIQGATFKIKGKPFIVITDYMKRYHLIWFTLGHELFHVVRDFNKIPEGECHFSMEKNYENELSDDGQKSLSFYSSPENEDAANKFSDITLVPNKLLDAFMLFIESPGEAKKFADINSIHLSILYGRYLREYSDDRNYAKYQKYLTKIDVLANRNIQYDMSNDLWLKNHKNNILKLYNN